MVFTVIFVNTKNPKYTFCSKLIWLVVRYKYPTKETVYFGCFMFRKMTQESHQEMR